MRNRDIVNDSDLVIAFWNGWSKGTASSIELAKRNGERVDHKIYLITIFGNIVR